MRSSSWERTCAETGSETSKGPGLDVWTHRVLFIDMSDCEKLTIFFPSGCFKSKSCFLWSFPSNLQISGKKCGEEKKGDFLDKRRRKRFLMWVHNNSLGPLEDWEECALALALALALAYVCVCV